MKTKSRLWVWIAVGLFSATGWAGAEQDLGINALTDVPEVEGKIAENLARVEHAQTRQAQIDTEISGLADKREEAEERLHERARALYRIRRAGMLRGTANARDQLADRYPRHRGNKPLNRALGPACRTRALFLME